MESTFVFEIWTFFAMVMDLHLYLSYLENIPRISQVNFVEASIFLVRFGGFWPRGGRNRVDASQICSNQSLFSQKEPSGPEMEGRGGGRFPDPMRLAAGGRRQWSAAVGKSGCRRLSTSEGGQAGGKQSAGTSQHSTDTQPGGGMKILGRMA